MRPPLHIAPTRRARRSRGITLLMTLIVIIALLGLGISGVWIASQSTNFSGNLVARQHATNAAFAGVQHARLVLTAISNSAATSCPAHPTANEVWSCALAGTSPNNTLVPTASVPRNHGAVLYDATNAMIDFSSPSGSTTTNRLGSFTVWVRNDPADIAKGNYTVDTNGAVIIRSEGKDPSGTATVVVEAAMTQLSIAGGVSNENTIFGKNIDPYGSNTITGAFHF